MSRLSEKAYKSVKSSVMEKPSGTFYSVRKSATELGMSYTPVREALLQLHAEGLLERVPNVGFFTVKMDMRMITNIYQSRECVEQYVLPKIIRELTSDDIAFLKQMIESQRQSLLKGDISAYMKDDQEFHCYLIDKLDNTQISDFYRGVRTQYRIGSQEIAQEHSMVSVEEHEEFLEMLEKKEYEGALKNYAKHAILTVERMREGFVTI